jgi:hypothetical protein
LFPASREDIIGRIFLPGQARLLQIEAVAIPAILLHTKARNFLFYELKEILNLAGRMIFADLHIRD